LAFIAVEAIEYSPRGKSFSHGSANSHWINPLIFFLDIPSAWMHAPGLAHMREHWH
jgi:hypothetical protein